MFVPLAALRELNCTVTLAFACQDAAVLADGCYPSHEFGTGVEFCTNI